MTPSTWCNHSNLVWHIHVHFPSGVPDISEPSRTFPMKTPEPFSNPETGLSLYESYSPDHSGSPRDILDPIRDSEQHSVSYSSFHNYSNNVESLSVSPYGSWIMRTWSRHFSEQEPIEESGNSYGSHIFLRLLCDRMNHLHTIPISLCLTIVYLYEVMIVGIFAYLVQPRYW